MIDGDHKVSMNYIKIQYMYCANERRFYTYDCCSVFVRMLLSILYRVKYSTVYNRNVQKRAET